MYMESYMSKDRGCKVVDMSGAAARTGDLRRK